MKSNTPTISVGDLDEISIKSNKSLDSVYEHSSEAFDERSSEFHISGSTETIITVLQGKITKNDSL